MTLTIPHANTCAPETNEDIQPDGRKTPKKKTWSTVVKRFWEFTEATSEGEARSFKGLL